MAESGPTPEEIWEALVESVKLQSHYAGLLNAYDGGQRMGFASPHGWINRLRQLKQEAREVGDGNGG